MNNNDISIVLFGLELRDIIVNSGLHSLCAERCSHSAFHNATSRVNDDVARILINRIGFFYYPGWTRCGCGHRSEREFARFVQLIRECLPRVRASNDNDMHAPRIASPTFDMHISVFVCVLYILCVCQLADNELEYIAQVSCFCLDAIASRIGVACD